MSYETGTLDSLRQAIRQPPPARTEEPKFSAWGMVSSLGYGALAAGAEVSASLAELAAAMRYTRDATKEQLRGGLPDEAFQSDLADSYRSVAASYRPDPVTAHGAEKVMFGLSRTLTKIVPAAMSAGPAGVMAVALEEANTQGAELKAQGVTDKDARQKAAAIQGAGLALAALPAAGTTVAGTLALYAAGGPGGFIAQQALTRKVLEDAGYAEVAKQFDPLDPVGLALSVLVPAPFAYFGMRSARAAETAQIAAGPIPSDVTPVAAAARQEVFDAARVMFQTEQRAAGNPGASMDAHLSALAKAEEQFAFGEPVQVDVAASRSMDAARVFDEQIAQLEAQPRTPEIEQQIEALTEQRRTADPLVTFGKAIEQLQEARRVDNDAPAQLEPTKTPKPAKQVQESLGKPRDLRSEVISLRKEQIVLNKLLECLNG